MPAARKSHAVVVEVPVRLEFSPHRAGNDLTRSKPADPRYTPSQSLLTVW